MCSLDHDVSEEVVSDDFALALEAPEVVYVPFAYDIADDDEVLAHLWMAVGTDAKMADCIDSARRRSRWKE
ncbi:hypothetical protein HFP57_07575 [Parasphingopyxis algicola]|uniref:hypothetical protein n=1 Tax=Parasphingopyxis algicola TaxID=2026624 RepID=UPI0015A4E624|nr:hypothetical protein [Parasphingopyxis algicola]QLC24902.1 hypothetical protein HFP57_07575 [Parasphingopyxis algicola]